MGSFFGVGSPPISRPEAQTEYPISVVLSISMRAAGGGMEEENSGSPEPKFPAQETDS